MISHTVIIITTFFIKNVSENKLGGLSNPLMSDHRMRPNDYDRHQIVSLS